MNNNEEMKFNPETGEPIEQQPISVVQANTQTLQSIPNVEQNETQFINNVETSSEVEQKNKKKDDMSAIIIGTIFVIVLMAILFLFPYLKNI